MSDFSTQRPFLSTGAFVAALLVISTMITPWGPGMTDHEPTKRALVVAISAYPEAGDPSDGYRPLNAHHDVELLTAALRLQHFGEIEVVADEEATADGIMTAIERLTGRVQPGDVVLFHYSGHGDQLPDDDGDELDGYDEVFVPYDASADFGDSYDGALHIRDDALSVAFEVLRERLGPGGSLLVTVDACYSGSATRKANDRQRAIPRRTVVPTRGRGGQDQGSGFDAAVSRETDGGDSRSSPTRGGSAALSPIVVLSASRHDEAAREVRDEDHGGRYTGALSLALSRSLPKLPGGASHRLLFNRVEQVMAAVAPSQTPQIEGDVDAALFGGGVVPQEPYFDVRAAQVDDAVILAGGSLLGLLPGSRIVVMPAGTANPDAVEALATATVIRSGPLESVARLDTGTNDGLDRTWAFVTAYSFGDLRISVFVADNLPRALASALRDTLANLAVVRTVDAESEADLVVEFVDAPAPRPGVVVSRASDGIPVSNFVELENAEAGALAGSILGFAQNLYLLRMKLDEPEYDVRLELLPARVELDEFTGDLIACDTLPTDDDTIYRGTGGEWRFHPGEWYRLRMRHHGTEPAYVAILSLTPDGNISPLFPPRRLTGEDNLLNPGDTFLIRRSCYRITEPYGIEVLKLFATRERVDFTPIIRSRGKSRSNITNPFELLLADVLAASRSDTEDIPAGSGSTHALTIHVEPDDGPNAQEVN